MGPNRNWEPWSNFILMDSTKPLVSIITVSFNAIDSIERTIKSVICQTYENIEYIVIDGGSSDGTQEIIEKYSSHIATWVSEKDNGIYHAMNKGIKLAKGKLIGILNADDRYFPETVEKVVGEFNAKPTDVVHGNLLKLNRINGKEYTKSLIPRFNRMEHSMGVLHPTCFVKADIYKRFGGYDESYHLSSDYDFVLRLYKSECTFSYINEPLAIFSLGGASSNELKSRWEKYLILKKHQTGNHLNELYRILRSIILNTTKAKMYQLGFGKIIDNRIKKKWS